MKNVNKFLIIMLMSFQLAQAAYSVPQVADDGDKELTGSFISVSPGLSKDELQEQLKDALQAVKDAQKEALAANEIAESLRKDVARLSHQLDFKAADQTDRQVLVDHATETEKELKKVRAELAAEKEKNQRVTADLTDKNVQINDENVQLKAALEKQKVDFERQLEEARNPIGSGLSSLTSSFVSCAPSSDPGQVDQLRLEIGTLQVALDERMQEICTLDVQNKKFILKIAESQQQIDGLREQNESLLSTKQALEQEIQRFQEASVAVSLSAELAAVGPSQKEFDALTSENTSLKESNAQLTEEKQTFERQVAQLTITKNSFKNDIKELKERNAQLTRTNSDLQRQVDELTRTNTDLQRRVDQLTGVNTDLQTRVDQLTGVNTDLQTRFDALTGVNTDLQRRVNISPLRRYGLPVALSLAVGFAGGYFSSGWQSSFSW